MAFTKALLPKCPQCGEHRLQIIESRTTALSTRRRKECDACGFRVTTHEVSSTFFEEAKNNQQVILKISKALGLIPKPNLLEEQPKCVDCFYSTDKRCSFDLPEYNTEDSYDCVHFKP